MKTVFLQLAIIIMLTNCQPQPMTESPTSDKGKIKVTILYPNGPDKTFDMDYYTNKHMPMVADLLGDSLKGWSVDKGLSGRTPADTVPYLAMGYLYFDQLSAYQNSFAPHAQTIVTDIPNYTNIQPVVQINEVVE